MAYKSKFSLINQSISVRCPKCGLQINEHIRSPQSTYNLNCRSCKTVFLAYVAFIRAKRSRGDRRLAKREFDVRVIAFDESEHHLQFSNDAYDDFELRQSDIAAFIYVTNELVAIQNVTIGCIYNIQKKDYTWVIYVIIIFVGFLALRSCI